MKRERKYQIKYELENDININVKRSGRSINKENKVKHTLWCLMQGQKYLDKITKEHCALCNTKFQKRNDNETAEEMPKCSYCNKHTCKNPECRLVTCIMCGSNICNLCARYFYESNKFTSMIICPDC